jgi:hypothetical protein
MKEKTASNKKLLHNRTKQTGDGRDTSGWEKNF